MLSEKLHLADRHLSDEELLLAADGELPARRTAQVHSHLAACWDCRARMAALEGTIADFARAHRQTLDPHLPPIAGPHALLRAQLAELASQPPAGAWRSLFHFKSPARAAALVCVTLFIAAVGVGLLLQRPTLRAANTVANSEANSMLASVAPASSERALEPDPGLTPGATRRVAVSDVCSMPHEEVVSEVSTAVRQEVFEEYGIANAHASDYEIDYLITPGLGGIGDIHNLWPEPSTASTWNAHVKDALEEYLHEMVCTGKLDLSTAQRDIATDWIAAYKKYFHTDKPLSLRSNLDSFAEVQGTVGD